MKKIFVLFMLTMLLFSFVGCKKDSVKTEDISEETTPVENVTQYVKNWSVYAYSNEEDLGKKSKDVKEKKYFEFGSKFTVIISKNIDGKDYYKIQLPDKSEYWVPKDSLTEKFIVINQTDVNCYEYPEPTYITPIKLQPGDFGLFVKEQDGWIEVEFSAYRPHKLKDDKRKWVGKKWIKDGYTEDLNAAKEAYYLYFAYHRNIIKKDSKEAIEMLNKALEVNAGEETEITYVVKDYLNELESGSTDTEEVTEE